MSRDTNLALLLSIRLRFRAIEHLAIYLSKIYLLKHPPMRPLYIRRVLQTSPCSPGPTPVTVLPSLHRPLLVRGLQHRWRDFHGNFHLASTTNWSRALHQIFQPYRRSIVQRNVSCVPPYPPSQSSHPSIFKLFLVPFESRYRTSLPNMCRFPVLPEATWT